MPIRTHKYTRDGITVLWQPDKCIHSAICAKGLSSVFNPRITPWIDMNKAETAQIADQVRKCPSGALSLLNDKCLISITGFTRICGIHANMVRVIAA